jgi:CubicO group peptidase (beta-lactamase class C family)
MILFERGDLLLNEPVATYLPELGKLRVAVDGDPARTEQAQRQPTIRDLLRHTSGHAGRGVPDSRVSDSYSFLYPDGRLTAGLTADEYVATLADLPLAYEPGTTWDYSLGFDLLGIVIERVTGQRAFDFLAENLFQPLKMQDTQFRIPAAKSSRQAKPLSIDPVTGAAQTVRDQSIARQIDCGSGCLSSTVDDYLAFTQMLLNGGQLNGVRILSPKTVEYMTSDHSESGVDLSNLHNFAVTHTDGFGFGLGVAVRRSAGGGGTMGSPGAYEWSGAQGTAFWVDPAEELAIVYMAQTPGALRRYYRQLIPALVYQSIID